MGNTRTSPFKRTKKGVDEVLGYFTQLNVYSFKARPMVMGVNDGYVIDCHFNWSNREGEENVEGVSCLLWQFKEGKVSKVYNFPQNQHLIDAFFNKAYAE